MAMAQNPYGTIFFQGLNQWTSCSFIWTPSRVGPCWATDPGLGHRSSRLQRAHLFRPRLGSPNPIGAWVDVDGDRKFKGNVNMSCGNPSAKTLTSSGYAYNKKLQLSLKKQPRNPKSQGGTSMSKDAKKVRSWMRQSNLSSYTIMRTQPLFCSS